MEIRVGDDDQGHGVIKRPANRRPPVGNRERVRLLSVNPLEKTNRRGRQEDDLELHR